MATQNLVIMFTDIKGFTARVSDGSRDDLTNLRRMHDKLLKPVFKHFKGNIIKTIGDAFLVTFKSPTDAVICGVTIQEVLRQHNFSVDQSHRLEVRVAINAGEVEVAQNDIFGEPVNIAARLESIAEAGEVYFTEAVYLSMNRNEAPTAEVGERTFKGIPYSVKIYKTILEPDSEYSHTLQNKVKITDNGPIINGQNITTNTKLNAKKIYSLVAVAIVLLVVLIVLTIPSKIDRALEKGNQALKSGDAVMALEIVNPLIRKNPEHKDLRELAIRSAEAQVYHLLKSQGAGASHEWLSNELVIKPYLEPLREKLPLLDALAVGDTIIQKTENSSKQRLKLRELLSRHPKNALVPYTLAEKLENINEFHAFWLYKNALKRGLEPNKQIFNYCTKYLRKTGYNYNDLFDILKKYYLKESISWAQNIVKTDVTGAFFAIGHAWRILRENDDPLIKDPYYSSLYAFCNGWGLNDEKVDQILEIFLKQIDPIKKKQLLSLAEKRVKYRSGYVEYIEYISKEIKKQLNTTETFNQNN